MANQIKNSINTRWAEIDVKGSPIWFGRAEYAIHRHHSAAVDFAYSGFRLQVALPDSLTKLNIPVKGELRYRTWSLLARYNFHIFPENRFDMYVGLGVGYRANNFKVADNDEEKDWWNFPIDLKWVTKMIPTSLSVPTVGADFTLGFRYFVLPPVALYAEFGVAKSIAQFGIVGRF